MNGILKLVDDTSHSSEEFDSAIIAKIMNGTYGQTIKIEEVIRVVLNQEKINPFGQENLRGKIPSLELPDKDDIETTAKQLKELIQFRKCKIDGICDIRDEIYLETFNELIRQIVIDCPERGILMSIVRDEIEKTIEGYKRIFGNSLSFAVRRQLSADESVQELTDKRAQLAKRLMALKNKKIMLNHQLDNLESNLESLELKNEAKRKEEVEFHKNQNNNVEEFLAHVKQVNDPLEVKANFEKNRK